MMIEGVHGHCLRRTSTALRSMAVIGICGCPCRLAGSISLVPHAERVGTGRGTTL
jgi:hypothetical protein